MAAWYDGPVEVGFSSSSRLLTVSTLTASEDSTRGSTRADGPAPVSMTTLSPASATPEVSTEPASCAAYSSTERCGVWMSPISPGKARRKSRRTRIRSSFCRSATERSEPGPVQQEQVQALGDAEGRAQVDPTLRRARRVGAHHRQRA